MYRLLVTHGYEERVFPVPDGEARMGRASENDIVLRAPGVSRHHALVRRRPEGVEVVDLGSKNRFFVDGKRVERVVLTPGLRLQIGTAWLELEEISSSEAALAFMLQTSSSHSQHSRSLTVIVQAKSDQRKLSPADRALTLAYHIAEVGAGLPGGRTDLLARIKGTLGAEAFVSFELRRRGRVRVLESEGKLFPKDVRLISALAEGARSSFPEEVILKRTGSILLAGREPWFLAAGFKEEALAQEGWRKDFLRFLAHQFFAPVRNLDDLKASEANRLLALVGGKSRTADLLGIDRGTLNKLLNLPRSPKR